MVAKNPVVCLGHMVKDLSKKLKDEMVIIIHTKEQVDEYTKKEPTIIYKEVECVCPELKNDGCVIEEPPSDEIKKIGRASCRERV